MNQNLPSISALPFSTRWLAAIALSLLGCSVCQAQMGYFGRGYGHGAAPSANAFRYRGPLLSIEVAPAYGINAPAPTAMLPPPPSPYSSRYGALNDPWFGPSPYSAYSAYAAPVFSMQFPSLFDTYRGAGPTRLNCNENVITKRWTACIDTKHAKCDTNPTSTIAMHLRPQWFVATRSLM